MSHFLFPFNLIEKESNIVLYGAGEVGLSFYKQLKLTQYANVVMWVDKNWKDYKWRGYPVSSITELSEIKFDYIVIAINNSEVVNEVKNQLENGNVDSDKIIFSDNYFCITDFLDNDSLNGEIMLSYRCA